MKPAISIKISCCFTVVQIPLTVDKTASFLLGGRDEAETCADFRLVLSVLQLELNDFHIIPSKTLRDASSIPVLLWLQKGSLLLLINIWAFVFEKDCEGCPDYCKRKCSFQLKDMPSTAASQRC